MRLTVPYVLLIAMLSCGTPAEEETIKTKSLSNFNLKFDYLNFKEKMEDGDTLSVFADLSICTSWHYEENFFVKRNGKVYIESVNDGEFVDSMEMTLSQVEYVECSSDTLSFEHLFKKLGDERRVQKEDSLVRISISHREDTIRYTTLGLIDAMRMVDSYTQIKRCLYPEIELYQPIVISKEG